MPARTADISTHDQPRASRFLCPDIDLPHYEVDPDPADASRRSLPRKVLTAASSSLVLAAIAALLVFGLGPLTGTYRTLTVLSGSMQPAFAPGDVILATKTAPRNVRVGDVIVFNEPVGDHHVTTHRVVKIHERGDLPLVQTKGDANNAVDPFELQIQGNELWVERGHVPKFGYVIQALRAPWMIVLAFCCLGLLAIASLWEVWFATDRDSIADAFDS